MKKILMSLLLIICTVFSPPLALAKDNINYDNIKLLYVGPFLTAFMDGQIRVVENVPRYIFPLMSQRPFIKDGKTYLPLRLTFHILGYQIDWKKDDDNITIYNDNDKMILNKSTQKITVGDKTMDMPLLLMNNSYFVPLRALSAVTGDNIIWDNDTRTVIYVRKGSKLVKPPVTITDINYKRRIEDKDNETVDIYFTIKNTSGETIPKDKLWYIVATRYPALKDEEIILRQLSWPGGYPLNEDEDLLNGQTVSDSTAVSTSVTLVNGVPRFDGSGAYEVYILGILDKDPYMRQIYWSPPLP
ncbi:MAG: hypothetical protein PWQ97_1272 [Tepidanaerobacteraceae bacterium]|nr:hypothetical protein [Tepidanaerobacteraceae bacterium]